MLLNDYPDQLVGVQIHTSYYTTAWGNVRKSFYGGVPGIPDAFFDAMIRKTGAYTNDGQQYNYYRSAILGRLNVPTDVNIEIYGEPVDGKAELPTYLITTYVSLDEGGEAKTVRVNILDVLANYPAAGDTRYPACVRNGHQINDVELVPGETVELTQEITFRTESEGRPEDIQIVVFVEKPASNWSSGEVYQSEMATWPLTPPPSCPEDVNDDDLVDIDDLFDVLGHWGEGPGTYDVNDDGLVDIDDIFAILAAWGPC